MAATVLGSEFRNILMCRDKNLLAFTVWLEQITPKFIHPLTCVQQSQHI